MAAKSRREFSESPLLIVSRGLASYRGFLPPVSRNKFFTLPHNVLCRRVRAGRWSRGRKRRPCWTRRRLPPERKAPFFSTDECEPVSLLRCSGVTSREEGAILLKSNLGHQRNQRNLFDVCPAAIYCAAPLLGPFKINGVPLRRVNQAYVIGTSTKVDISVVNVDKFTDKLFSKEKERKKKKTEGEFFEADKEEKKSLPQDRKDDQKAVDEPLLKAIDAVPDLRSYLGARFSLKDGMKPHELKF